MNINKVILQGRIESFRNYQNKTIYLDLTHEVIVGKYPRKQLFDCRVFEDKLDLFSEKLVGKDVLVSGILCQLQNKKIFILVQELQVIGGFNEEKND